MVDLAAADRTGCDRSGCTGHQEQAMEEADVAGAVHGDAGSSVCYRFIAPSDHNWMVQFYEEIIVKLRL